MKITKGNPLLRKFLAPEKALRGQFMIISDLLRLTRERAKKISVLLQPPVMLFGTK